MDDFHQRQGLLVSGQRFGQERRKQLNEKKNSSGLLKNRSSTVLGKLEAFYFIDLEDMKFKEIMKNARKKIGVAHGINHAL